MWLQAHYSFFLSFVVSVAEGNSLNFFIHFTAALPKESY